MKAPRSVQAEVDGSGGKQPVPAAPAGLRGPGLAAAWPGSGGAGMADGWPVAGDGAAMVRDVRSRIAWVGLTRVPGCALLQSAGVIGKDVPFILLHAVAEETQEGVRRHLAFLQSGEFLYETRLLPDSEYTFKHALTQEVAYGGLLSDRRRAIHARIVDAIERLQGDRLLEQ